MFGTAASGVSINPNKDVELVSPPDDGVSSLCWSSKGNFLVGTSWNSSAYCWEVNAQGGSQPKTSTKLEQPVLCSAWHHDGDKVFLAGCDKKASLWQLGSNSVQQVGAHDAPIRHVAWIPRMNLLATGSWDRTLKYWDLRSPTPVHTQQLSERVYAMDCRDPLLVVGTADRQIHVINLNTPQQIFKSVQSPLKYQTRCAPAQGNRPMPVVDILLVFSIYVCCVLARRRWLACRNDGCACLVCCHMRCVRIALSTAVAPIA